MRAIIFRYSQCCIQLLRKACYQGKSPHRRSRSRSFLFGQVNRPGMRPSAIQRGLLIRPVAESTRVASLTCEDMQNYDRNRQEMEDLRSSPSNGTGELRTEEKSYIGDGDLTLPARLHRRCISSALPPWSSLEPLQRPLWLPSLLLRRCSSSPDRMPPLALK